jgi:RNA polymerase sigma factor (sigma-70 family)
VQGSPRRQDPSGPSIVATLGTEHAAGSDPDRLLARCRLGDAAAWDELVARYEWLVFGVARRNGLSREDAADVTQATFLALLESLETIRAEDRLASWLMTVSRRQSWALRNRALREAPGADEVVDRVDDHDPVACWEQLTVLHDALDGLAKPCRELLRALYLDPAEPSYQQVADRFGFRIGGIGPMRARCLRRLRQDLGEDVFV